MTMSVMSEHAASVLKYNSAQLYTADEAEDELNSWEAVGTPYVLALGGASGGYFGLCGTLDEIEAVLMLALEQVRER